MAVIEGLDAALRELTVYRGEVLLAHRQGGSWSSGRDRDFPDWRARVTGAGRGAALGELQVAEGLELMPEVAAAVAGGELTLEHARVLARVRAGGSREVKESLTGAVVADLVERGKSLSAPELGREARKVAARIDAQAAQESYTAVWRRRKVTTSGVAGGGRRGEWFLDDVGAAIVETALDAVVGTPAKDDTRSREQRWADALVMMAGRVLQVGNDLTGAQVRPHLALLVQDRTWAALRLWRQQQAGTGQDGSVCGNAGGDAGGGGAGAGETSAGAGFGLTGAARPEIGCTFVSGRPGPRVTGPRVTGPGVTGPDATAPGATGPVPAVAALPDVDPGELEDGTVIPLGELERLMCDCEVTRMVVDATGVPLDVGQTQRTYAKELRRAVTTRDRHCQWPGCAIRASWCEVHHLWWYSRGGPTSVELGLTVCSFHHHRIHNEHVSVTILADGYDFHHRDGRPIGTTRRHPRTAGRRRDAGDGLSPPRCTADGPEAVLLASWPPALTGARPPTAQRPSLGSSGAIPDAATGTDAGAAADVGGGGPGSPPRTGDPPVQGRMVVDSTRGSPPATAGKSYPGAPDESRSAPEPAKGARAAPDTPDRTRAVLASPPQTRRPGSAPPARPDGPPRPGTTTPTDHPTGRERRERSGRTSARTHHAQPDLWDSGPWDGNTMLDPRYTKTLDPPF
ncbi:HNH endonuclease signature motif containing protein [Georgenia muralis]|uniref:HNH endonuclease signature motif containing protein n=1 Tax=Georgenia muralis TaxID=154117 RepID=UPI00147696D1|nr:HNH endonuclease signature motif containing protein [Georgenia muralis]